MVGASSVIGTSRGMPNTAAVEDSTYFRQPAFTAASARLTLFATFSRQ
jgi:hypothetical protein